MFDWLSEGLFVCLFSWRYNPLWLYFYSPVAGFSLLISRFLDHTQRRATVGRTPLDEWSICRRDIYLTTHNTHNRQTSTPCGIRTHNLSGRAAVDLSFRPRGHGDRHLARVSEQNVTLSTTDTVKIRSRTQSCLLHFQVPNLRQSQYDSEHTAACLPSKFRLQVVELLHVHSAMNIDITIREAGLHLCNMMGSNWWQ
jgi:hypothetical protein